jgi:hypothetical protein
MTGSAPSAAGAVSLAVLGDSGGHSYQDSLVFVAPNERGGAFRSVTFQWTEVLARLRPGEIDLGPWVRWGSRNRVARLRELLGLSGQRVPRKEDYLYNFAVTGAACKHLMGNRIRQAPRLVALMNQQPERWRDGVVVIRVGSNDFTPQQDLAARDPWAPALRAVAEHCAREIARAVALIHGAHPAARIVLVGLPGDADDPLYVERWQTAEETANLRAALDLVNGAIRGIGAGDPRIAFADFGAWLAARVGTRTPAGKPDYRTIAIGPRIRVTHTVGDDPHNSVLADDHGGVAINALWAQSLVQQLIDDFGLPLTPIGDEEVVRFLEPLFEAAATAPGS